MFHCLKDKAINYLKMITDTKIQLKRSVQATDLLNTFLTEG